MTETLTLRCPRHPETALMVEGNRAICPECDYHRRLPLDVLSRRDLAAGRTDYLPGFAPEKEARPLTPFYTSTDATLHLGDARAALAQLPAGSVHACVTSPPYYLMRSYRAEPTVWGGHCEHGHEHEWGAEMVQGGPAQIQGETSQRKGRSNVEAQVQRGASLGQFCTHTCEHEWVDASFKRRSKDTGKPRKQASNVGANDRDVPLEGAVCGKCDAWRGTLGSEPTPELFIEHLAEVFRAVARVMRPDGVMWLNLGDTMATHASGGAAHAHNFYKPEVAEAEGVGTLDKPSAGALGGREKDAMLMPFRVVMRLQQDGWTVRGQPIPWIKRSAMPESVKDRPANALEWIFCLTRSRRYYYDGFAVRQAFMAGSLARRGRADSPREDPGYPEYPERKPQNLAAHTPTVMGRNYRNTDAYFATLEDEIAYTRDRLSYLYGLRRNGGILATDEGDILAIDLNPLGFGGQHYATFPEHLIEPLIRAATSEVGACPACNAPWRRVVGPTEDYGRLLGKGVHDHVNDAEVGMRQGPGTVRTTAEYVSLAWEPGCKCAAACAECPKGLPGGRRPDAACAAHRPVPATVLDPFCGTATVALACRKLNRRSVGVDISEEYLGMGKKRLDVRGAIMIPLAL